MFARNETRATVSGTMAYIIDADRRGTGAPARFGRGARTKREPNIRYSATIRHTSGFPGSFMRLVELPTRHYILNDRLKDYTERALQATYSGELIPPIVYLPAKLRRGKQRLNSKGYVTLDPKTPEEVEASIAAADPAGLLIALMQGQPIPAFRISAPDPTGRVEIATEYVVAPLELRADIAWKLSARQRARKGNEDKAFAARVAEAVAAAEDDA